MITKDEEGLDVVGLFKYFWVNFELNWYFRQHVKTVKYKIIFILANFQPIRPFLTMESAKTYMSAMVFVHGLYFKPIQFFFINRLNIFKGYKYINK